MKKFTEAVLYVIMVIAVLAAVGAAAYFVPQYKIYKKELNGKAELAEATFERQILIEEAAAEKEAAVLFAEAEVIRAAGAAESIAIVGEALQENPAYLQYRFIEGLNDSTGEVVYVATEFGLPTMLSPESPFGTPAE